MDWNVTIGSVLALFALTAKTDTPGREAAQFLLIVLAAVNFGLAAA